MEANSKSVHDQKKKLNFIPHLEDKEKYLESIIFHGQVYISDVYKHLYQEREKLSNKVTL